LRSRLTFFFSTASSQKLHKLKLEAALHVDGEAPRRRRNGSFRIQHSSTTRAENKSKAKQTKEKKDARAHCYTHASNTKRKEQHYCATHPLLFSTSQRVPYGKAVSIQVWLRKIDAIGLDLCIILLVFAFSSQPHKLCTLLSVSLSRRRSPSLVDPQ
jgi:hypothetical protein